MAKNISIWRYIENAPVLEAPGHVRLAWMNLLRATVASPNLGKLVGSLDTPARSAKAAKNEKSAFL